MSAEPGFVCPFCGDHAAIIYVMGQAKCSECREIIQISSDTQNKKPCKCGKSSTGFCGCKERKFARVGIAPAWHCVDCGQSVDPPR